MKSINFYRTPSNECPVEVFLDSLTSKQAKKIAWVMQLVEELKQVPDLYLKKLTNTDDIWEIRAQLGSNIFRVLGFFVADNTFIATNGFQKKTQKTPINEITLAEKRKADYLKRRGKT